MTQASAALKDDVAGHEREAGHQRPDQQDPQVLGGVHGRLEGPERWLMASNAARQALTCPSRA